MTVVREPNSLQIDRSGRVGLIPTMGAFHEGHLSLMRNARSECDSVVVSLFANPIQFDSKDDLTRYPRNEARDCELAESVGVDTVFAPSVESMYLRTSTRVVVSEVSQRWEGEYRPGHFDGVATIVCKLFNLIRPDMAYFGKKDLQQCSVVGRMVEDLNMPVRISVGETVRESDGLAMSSRNANLTPEQRRIAPELFAELSKCRDLLVESGYADSALRHSLKRIKELGFAPDYLALVDSESLEPLDRVRSPASLIAAARLGRTRLIDNVDVSP